MQILVRFKPSAAMLCGMLFLSAAGILSAAEAALKAGAARVEASPDIRLNNWVTHKPYGAALDPLHVRAVVMEAASNKVALVSWELVYAYENAVARLRERIRRETGIPETNILVCATHNHSGPWSLIFGDPMTEQERRNMEAYLADPLYPAWADTLMNASVRAVKEADAALRPATLAIGRASGDGLTFNRRPRRPDGSVESLLKPPHPHALPRGLRFGTMDHTATLLMLRDSQSNTIAGLLHFTCHAVTVYPEYDGVSSDWPGAASEALRQKLGGEIMVLQGCAGDIVPMARGLDARKNLSAALAERGEAAARFAQPLPAATFRTGREVLAMPATEAVRRDTRLDTLPAEVQVVVCGPLALVALPGEPMTAIAQNIQVRSPFPHTVVIGYANGLGTQYVGMPGEKARGGYESGSRNLGDDSCGQRLADAAVRLLEQHARP